jgi:hypothetical protein
MRTSMDDAKVELRKFGVIVTLRSGSIRVEGFGTDDGNLGETATVNVDGMGDCSACSFIVSIEY